LTAHLATCETCRTELDQLRAAVHVLPLTLDDRSPSPILRYRLQAALQRDLAASERGMPPARPLAPPTPALRATEPARLPAPGEAPQRRRRVFVPWAAAAALALLVSIGMLVWNVRLRDELDRQPAVTTIALQPAPAAGNATGELTYLHDRKVFILRMRDLPPLPANQIYEVWLLGDDAPQAVGVLARADAEFAVAADIEQYDALALTVEPGPFGGTAPSSDPIVVAPFSTA
jgi:hypothetical protein